MKMIWIVGSSGHVGSALMKVLDTMKYEILTTDKNEVNIADEEQVYKYMSINRPDVVINCAGVSDPVECENNMDLAYQVNAVGVRNLAQAAESIQAKLIQISTDDVFDMKSDRPYNEFDDVHPKTVYGKSKYAGECFIKQLMTRYVIVRSSWVYGMGKDFVDEVLGAVGKVDKLMVPDNRYAVPTSANVLADVILQFIDTAHYGTYHVVCSGGSCSRYEYAKEILKCAGKEGQLEIQPADVAHGALPAYSVLDNMMMRITGLYEPADWKEELKEYIHQTGGIE